MDLTVAEPFVTIAGEPQSVRRGDRLSYRWSVKHVRPFSGKATARLIGLPVGVSMVSAAPTIDATTTDLAFELEASDDALLGMVNGLSCELVFTIDGDDVRLRSGTGKLRIDPRKS